MRKLFFIIFLIQFNFIQSDYSLHPRADFVVNELVNSHGFEEGQVLDVLKNAKKQQTIIDRISAPAEFTITWDAYRNIFIEDKRIKNGKKFIENNLLTLKKAEQEFGVPKEIITAILGVETRYGNIQGKDRVLDSLTTLGFDYPRRAEFFRNELIKFFILTRENNLDIYSVKGSYAGAMGFAQFMPDNYRRLALDFDEDGKRDIMNNAADAIGSVANFLSSDLGNKRGWDRNGFIALPAQAKRKNKSIKSSFKLVPYKELDIVYEKDNLDFSKKYIQISLFPKNEERDEFWIGDKNLYAITRYNPSSKYAMSVFLLSEELKN